MKLLLAILTFFTIINLNSNSTYKTKEQEFIEIVHTSYDEYVIHDLDNNVGDLILVVGKVNQKLSCSIYYKNTSDELYNINIIDENKNKEYTLSDYEQFQIYYNINLKEGNKYYLNIVGKTSKLSYTKYLIVDDSGDFNYNNLELVKGSGNPSFPYNTKLKNRLSPFTIYMIIGIIFVIFEVIVFILIRKYKKKEKTTTYTNLNFNVLDEIEENKDEE